MSRNKNLFLCVRCCASCPSIFCQAVEGTIASRRFLKNLLQTPQKNLTIHVTSVQISHFTPLGARAHTVRVQDEENRFPYVNHFPSFSSRQVWWKTTVARRTDVPGLLGGRYSSEFWKRDCPHRARVQFLYMILYIQIPSTMGSDCHNGNPNWEFPLYPAEPYCCDVWSVTSARQLVPHDAKRCQPLGRMYAWSSQKFRASQRPPKNAPITDRKNNNSQTCRCPRDWRL